MLGVLVLLACGAPTPPDGEAPRTLEGRWGEAPPHRIALTEPGEDMQAIGEQLIKQQNALGEAAGAPRPPDADSPTMAYMRQLMMPMTTPLLLGLNNPMSNLYTSPLVRSAAPIVANPYNPMGLLSPSLLGLRSPRISQYGTAVPPLPYPYYNEP